MRKKISMGLVLVLLAISFMGLKLKLDRIQRKKVPGSSIIYIPSGKYLKLATFGYSSLVADIIYIWAIQYYSDQTIPNKFDYFVHIFSIISELDPKYVDPYEVGALIAFYDAKDIALALKILDLGFAKNPSYWIFPLEAGHYAQLYKKDFALAKEYFKKAMDIPGAPAIAKRLYANASFRVNDVRTAWETWLEVYKTAPDEQIRKIASNHLYRVKAAVDITTLEYGVAKFREKYGRNPLDLSQLIRAKILPLIPKDFDGKDYLYDPKVGDIKTQVVPWKR